MHLKWITIKFITILNCKQLKITLALLSYILVTLTLDHFINFDDHIIIDTDWILKNMYVKHYSCWQEIQLKCHNIMIVNYRKIKQSIKIKIKTFSFPKWSRSSPTSVTPNLSISSSILILLIARTKKLFMRLCCGNLKWINTFWLNDLERPKVIYQRFVQIRT